MSNKNLYDFFHCNSKEELYKKMKKGDESVKELIAFYDDYNVVPSSKLDMCSTKKAYPSIVKNGFIPDENGYTLIGLNSKKEAISFVKFKDNEDFVSVFEKINVKGLCNAILVDNTSPEMERKNWKIKFKKELASLCVPIVDAVCIQKETENTSLIISMMHMSTPLTYNHHEALHNNILQEDFFLSNGNDLSLRQLNRFDEYSFYYLQQRLKGLNVFIDKDEINRFLVLGNLNFKTEHVQIISYDENYNIVSIDITSMGGVFSAVAEPSVYRDKMLETQNGIIMVHNHPSGNTEPSSQDFVSTKRAFEVAQMLGVELLDHYIVGDTVNFLSEDKEYKARWFAKMCKNKIDKEDTSKQEKIKYEYDDLER